jgi:urease accessory protein
MGTARCMGMEEMVIPTPTEARTPAPPAIGGTNATAALYRLMTWLSPQFPVGSYTYSHGIEQAVEAGYIRDAATTRAWIEDILAHGAGRSDAILFRHAHAAALAGDGMLLAGIAELAAAFQPTSELALESHAQGRAFLETVRKTWDCPALAMLAAAWNGPQAFAVTVAVAAAGHGIGAPLAAQTYLHAFAANLVSAAVRLVPLGQTDGQRLIAGLEPLVAGVVDEAGCVPLDDLGSAVVSNDICAMRH